MPHIVLEYSANLESAIDWPNLLDATRQAAIASGVFPAGGVRVRAHRCDHVSIADGDGAHAFVDVVVRIGEGRDPATRKRAGQAIFDAVADALAPIHAKQGLALALEMREIDSALSWKRNNLHELLKNKPEG